MLHDKAIRHNRIGGGNKQTDVDDIAEPDLMLTVDRLGDTFANELASFVRIAVLGEPFWRSPGFRQKKRGYRPNGSCDQP